MKINTPLLALGCVVVGLTVTAAWLRSTEDPADRVLRSLPVESAERPDGSPLSARHHRDFARLVNRLGRRAEWSPDDAAWIRGMIAEPWPDAGEPTAEEIDAVEDLMERDMALSIIGTRVRYGIETDHETLATFARAVLDMLQHPRPWVRRMGVAAAGNSLLIEHDPYRTIIEGLAVGDPAGEVRRIAGIKLGHAQAAGEPCAGCP